MDEEPGRIGPDRFVSSRERLEEILGQRFHEGNALRLLSRGPEAFETIFDALTRARALIGIEFYIIRDDTTGRRLAEILSERARSGVRVFLRYDHFGSIGTPAVFWERLRRAGVQVMASRPFRWAAPNRYLYRNHRKLIVVDGVLAFTGGLNIGDEYRGRYRRKSPWRDTGILIRGPAAAELFRIFRDSWQGWGGSFVPEVPVSPSLQGTAPVIPIFTNSARERRRMRKLLYFSIRRARQTIHLTTAYFTPSRRMVYSLEEAVGRGVTVDLLLPGESDSRSPFYAGRYFFQRLLCAGVRIHTYQGSILHAKTAVFDGEWSVIGSSNLDFRSLRRNDEGNVGVLDRAFGRKMLRMFEEDLERSQTIEIASWKRRPFVEKLLERFFVLFRRRL